MFDSSKEIYERMNGTRFRAFLKDNFPEICEEWDNSNTYLHFDINFLKNIGDVIEPHIPKEWIEKRGYIPAARRWIMEDPERFRTILEFDKL